MAVLDELQRARRTAEEVAAEEHKFEDGFTFRTFLGLLFVAFVMLPGSIYMGLVAGVGLGSAAEWVTIVLFAEVMRRSLQPLKRQEIYMLFYIAASLTAMGLYGLSGGPLQWKIWDQFFVQSAPATPFAKEIPHWAVPAPDSVALRERTFLHPDWYLPLALLILTEILGRASWMSMGYLVFRMTSDVERSALSDGACGSVGRAGVGRGRATRRIVAMGRLLHRRRGRNGVRLLLPGYPRVHRHPVRERRADYSHSLPGFDAECGEPVADRHPGGFAQSGRGADWLRAALSNRAWLRHQLAADLCGR
jgi:hypothetical protein